MSFAMLLKLELKCVIARIVGSYTIVSAVIYGPVEGRISMSHTQNLVVKR